MPESIVQKQQEQLVKQQQWQQQRLNAAMVNAAINAAFPGCSDCLR